jgi:ATP-dependent exoDNAse (exonuclease V) beta subunit
VRDLDKEAEDIEAGRLLYVAATRAESRLHLLACLKVDEDGVMKMPSKRSLLGLAWRALSSSISLPSPALAGQGNTWGGAEGEGERERASLSAGELHRLPADFEMPEAPEATEWKVQEEGREEEQVEFSWVGETARHMGTVVHAWLHRIADDELKGWDTARVARARAAVRGQLFARGVSGDELQAATERVLEALRNSITDQKGRWVLGPHSEAYCEYRIRTRDRSYVIDRLIRDANGTRWLVDYKTSRHEGADIEGFLDREQKRYAAQLDAYAAAFGGASRGLYFPLHKGWRSW